MEGPKTSEACRRLARDYGLRLPACDVGYRACYIVQLGISFCSLGDSFPGRDVALGDVALPTVWQAFQRSRSVLVCLSRPMPLLWPQLRSLLGGLRPATQAHG